MTVNSNNNSYCSCTMLWSRYRQNPITKKEINIKLILIITGLTTLGQQTYGHVETACTCTYNFKTYLLSFILFDLLLEESIPVSLWSTSLFVPIVGGMVFSLCSPLPDNTALILRSIASFSLVSEGLFCSTQLTSSFSAFLPPLAHVTSFFSRLSLLPSERLDWRCGLLSPSEETLTSTCSPGLYTLLG